MSTLVAFLRGVNLGKRRIKMEDLRAAFEGMGFAGARTLIASGNVLFDGIEALDLAGRIAAGLEARFGFAVPTILRSLDALTELRDADPFEGRMEDDDTKLYAFFLAQPEMAKLTARRSVAGDYDIVGQTETAFFAVAHRMESGRFGEGLDQVAKPFETRITNRNWNTVLRLIELANA